MNQISFQCVVVSYFFLASALSWFPPLSIFPFFHGYVLIGYGSQHPILVSIAYSLCALIFPFGRQYLWSLIFVSLFLQTKGDDFNLALFEERKLLRIVVVLLTQCSMIAAAFHLPPPELGAATIFSFIVLTIYSTYISDNRRFIIKKIK